MSAREEQAQASNGPAARRALHLQHLGKTRRLTVTPSRTFHRFETNVPKTDRGRRMSWLSATRASR